MLPHAACACHTQEVHPFQFLTGTYSDELYEQEVATCASAYRHDAELRDKVAQAARSLFKELQHSQHTVDRRETSIQHKSITFRMICFLDKVCFSCLAYTRSQHRHWSIRLVCCCPQC